MIRVHLTAEERRAVEQVSRQAVGRVALRAHMVLLAGRGYRVPQIARIHDCGEDVGRHWLHRYQDLGGRGWRMRPAAGGPPKTRWRAASSTRRPVRARSARATCRVAGR